MTEKGVLVDYKILSNDALIGVIKSFVLEEGTDYGHDDWSIEEKINQVKDQLLSGKASIVFNRETESASITIREDK